MNLSSLIQNIKDLLWESTLEFLKSDFSYKEYIHTKEGSLILGELFKNEKVSQFQWYCLSGNIPYDLLSNYIIPNFLLTIKIYVNSINLVNDYSESEDLQKYFDTRFNDLETEVLLSENFKYLILIPTFRVLFPQGTKETRLDSQHTIKNLAYIESPYDIWNFKEIPKSWSRRWDRTANASIEVEFLIKKKLATEAPYNENTDPVAPFNSFGRLNDFDEKIRSIYEFFLCYGRESDFGGCTFGEKYYIKLPPFFQPYPHFKNFIISKFPPPYAYLDLNLPKEHPHYHDWIKIWNEKYMTFYKNFYYTSTSHEENEIFRYALEVLRTFINIPYNNIQNFLLISTFEGILYQGDVYKILNNNKAKYNMPTDITKNNKRTPCTKVFLEVCQEQEQYWQYIFQKKYPLSDPLKDFETKEDIVYFIDLSFTYRNNIAHPEKVTPINIKEEYISPHPTMGDIWILIQFIKDNFPFFILFLLRTWLKKGFKTKNEWYNYILNLVK